MIIGENRAQVIENIKAAVKKGKMHAKVELGDPILTKDERIKLVNNYWEQQKKLSHKFKNIIAQTIINLDTLVLMAHTQIKNKQRIRFLYIRMIGTIEPLKNFIIFTLGNTNPFILDLHECIKVLFLNRNRDMAILRTILYRIIQNIDDCFSCPVLV